MMLYAGHVTYLPMDSSGGVYFFFFFFFFLVILQRGYPVRFVHRHIWRDRK